MIEPAPRPARSAPLALRVAAGLLTAAVAGIVTVGFAGSYGPLRDAFLAIHQDRHAAARDPFAVDGLIAVAVAAAIWLNHDTRARRYALTVAAVTTGASLLLNFLHGQGLIGPGGRISHPLHPVLVFTIASLPVAAVGFGSHLLVACLHQLRAAEPHSEDGQSGPNAVRSLLSAVPEEPYEPTGTDQDGKAEPGTPSRTRTAVTQPRPRDRTRRPGAGDTAGRGQPDPELVALGRQALAGLMADGVPPTRDALRARMGVGTGKASKVWAVLQDD